MSELAGTPSDRVADVIAAGGGDVTTLFVSMAKRHPRGEDVDYLRWHTLDHRPEQHRLSAVRASLRAVSTPACRAARVAQQAPFDAIDHVMTYFFRDLAGLDDFSRLSKALAGSGRVPFVLEPVQRGVYAVDCKIAASRIKAGADVLPWWPVKGIYVLVERAGSAPVDLVDIPGIGGVWSGRAISTSLSNAAAGQRVTYCFLDDDPVAVAERLRPLLGTRPHDLLFAAPFQMVVPYAWDRHLP